MEAMTDTPEDRRRAPRQPARARATILWIGDDEASYTLRGHIRDASPGGCSVVSLSAIPPVIGAIAVPELGVLSRFRTTHTRREGLLRITGIEYLASLPAS